MDTDLLLSPVTYVGAIIGLIALLLLLTRFLANVGATEIAIKERRYFGSRMPPGRVVATEGEVGIQADVLKPGLHIIKWPFERVVKKASLIEIGADEMGVIEAIDGEPLPPGRIFAPDRVHQTWRRKRHSDADAATRLVANSSLSVSCFDCEVHHDPTGQDRHRDGDGRRSARSRASAGNGRRRPSQLPGRGAVHPGRGSEGAAGGTPDARNLPHPDGFDRD